MNKQKVILLYSTIAIITIGFITIGIIFKKTDLEKLNGLTEIFDISSEGDIAYVSYDKGKSGIYLKNKDEDRLLTQYNEEKLIEDISFLQNENKLVYSLVDRELDTDPISSLHMLDTDTGKNKKIHESNGIITEVVIDPKNNDMIFFLKSLSYENYSPIARKAPHNFDLYRYDIGEEQQTKLTNWDKYSMQSLNISATEEKAYVQMIDDEDANSADEAFEAKQKVFQVPIDNPSELTIVSDEKREVDIYDFVLFPDESGMIFQSISNWESGGTFQYELYTYDWETHEEQQLTFIKEYVAKPTISETDSKVYFIVNKTFAKKSPDHYLYRMDMDGQNIKEIPLKYR